MSEVKTDVKELMKAINQKFLHERRQFEKERTKYETKFSTLEKELKERDEEKRNLRDQLSTAKKRNLELEKILLQQNSLLQRMRAKLEISFDKTLTTSMATTTNDEADRSHRRLSIENQNRPKMVDKCVSTDDWLTILEKELTERIELFAAAQENRLASSMNTSEITKRSDIDQRKSRNISADRSRFSNVTTGNYGEELVVPRLSTPSKESRSLQRNHDSMRENIRGNNFEPPQISMIGRHQASTPATSIWHASTPKSDHRYSRHDGEIENSEYRPPSNRSLPFDVSQEEQPTNADNSLLVDVLVRKFTELESKADDLNEGDFDQFDDDFGDAEAVEEENFGIPNGIEEEKGANSKNTSVLTDS